MNKTQVKSMRAIDEEAELVYSSSIILAVVGDSEVDGQKAGS
jgi:hypothetical protein